MNLKRRLNCSSDALNRMTTSHGTALERLAVNSLERCLNRISRVSAGTWEVLDVADFRGTLADAMRRHDFKNPAAAVYFNLKDITPMTAVMLADPADVECIAKGFTGHAFPRGSSTTLAEEVMLTELGNIVLNALINAPLNVLKKSFMPAAPLFMEGDFRRLNEELLKVVGTEQDLRIIAATLSVRCEKCVSRAEVFTILPEEIANALERVQPPAGE